MPCLRIFTNISKNKIPSDLISKIIPIISKAVGKPEKNFICVISPECYVSIAGDATKPGVTATLESIGHIDDKRNTDVIKELSKLLAAELDVIPERFFLTFYDVTSSNVGFAGTTVANFK